MDELFRAVSSLFGRYEFTDTTYILDKTPDWRRGFHARRAQD
jgi:hypothetical protein